MRFSALVLFLLINTSAVQAQPQEQFTPEQNQWTGAVEQRVWGLMTVWATAKYAFPHFNERPDLDWDKEVQEYIPKVIGAQDMNSYYLVLMEFAALLKDGHTGVSPPWGYFPPGQDTPPIEITVVNGRFVVARTADTEELEVQRVYPGLEILEIGDHVPVREYFRDQVLRYYTRGSDHANDAVLVIYLLYGPKDEKVQLTVKDTDGTIREIQLTRNSTSGNGEPFLYRFLQQSFFAEQIESRMLADDILYVSIPNFSNPQIASSFLKLIENTDMNEVRGLIIDVRQNMGGSNQVSNPVIGSLIEDAVSSTSWHFLHQIAAYRAWGLEEPEWDEKHEIITPGDGRRYSGPLVILTGPVTNSTSEDFAIILQQAGRAIIVGQSSAGGSGNPLAVPLPGGGVFEVSTFKATYPDGTEYASVGIQPDVKVEPTADDIFNGFDRVLEAGKTAIRER